MTLILQAAVGSGEIDLKPRIILFTAFDLHGKHTPAVRFPMNVTRIRNGSISSGRWKQRIRSGLPGIRKKPRSRLY